MRWLTEEDSGVNYMVNVDGQIKKYHIIMLLHCPERPERLRPHAGKILLTEMVNELGGAGLVYR